MPYSSLSKKIKWSSVLTKLGIAVENPNCLPNRADCPACAFGVSSLHVYKDRSGLSNEWLYCSNCKFTGDSLELIAKTTGMSISHVLLKLGIIETPEDVEHEQYLNSHIRYRDRINGLWKKANDGYPFDNSKLVRALLSKFQLTTSGIDHERWQQRLGQFIGGCCRNDVEAAFQPSSQNEPWKKGNTGMQRSFVGPHWTDVICTPFYDLPGRISGFYFIGREGEYPEDHTFRRTTAFTSNYKGYKEAGYGMLNLLLQPTFDVFDLDIVNPNLEKFNGCYFIVTDHVAGLKLHANHFKDSSTVLPLLTSQSNHRFVSGVDVWRAMPLQTKFIVTGREDQYIDVFRQAKFTDGYVGGYLTKQLNRIPASSFLRNSIGAKARYWKEALETLILELDPIKTDELLLMLGLKDDALRDFIRDCQPSAKSILERLYDQPLKRRKSTYINGKEVVENVDGWSLTQGKEQICDAILRIDQVIYRPLLEASFYRGKVNYKTDEVPFYVPREVIDNQPFKFMTQLLIEQGKGLLIGNQKWAKHAVTIASKFNPPECLTETSKYGWDENSATFIFPNFTIKTNGDIELTECLISKKIKGVPALDVKFPKPLTLIEKRELSSSSSSSNVNKLMWATLTAIIANVLAPLFNKPTAGIGLLGESAINVGINTALKVGCVDSVELLPATDLRLTDLVDIEAAHNFPTVMYIPVSQGKLFDSWVNLYKHNCVVNLPDDVANYNLSEWQIISQPDDVGETNYKLPKHVDALLPLYLQDLCKRNFKLSDHVSTFFQQVMYDVNEWAYSKGIF